MRAPTRSYVKKHDRSTALYYVRDVPADLRDKIGQGRWKISLGTANRAEATRKAHALAAEHDALIAAARRPTPLETLAPEDRARIEDARGIDGYLTFLDKRARKADRLQEKIEHLDGWSAQESSVGEEKGRPHNGGDIADPDWERAKIAAYRAKQKAIQSHLVREAPIVRHLEIPPEELAAKHGALAAVLSSTPTDPDAITLSGALAAWERQKKPQAPEQYRWPVKLFEEKFGPRPVKEITKADIRDFRDLLETLPPAPGLANKGVTLAELLRRAENGAPPISRSTASKYLRSVGTILRFAVSEGYLQHSPSEGIGYHKQRTKFSEAKDKHRRSLSPAEVRALLSAASTMPANKIETAWFVRLMLFTGARGEELSQLSPSDIRQHRGVTYLRIHDEGANKLKNSSSLRLIPVHRSLLDFGFTKFIEGRATSEHLFRTLKPDGRGRRYSRMQRRLTVVIRKLAKIDDERVVPHSLRHTFKDALRMAGTPDEIADRLMGHTSPDRAVATGYGNPDQIVALAPWLNKVDPLDENRLVSVFDDMADDGATSVEPQ